MVVAVQTVLGLFLLVQQELDSKCGVLVVEQTILLDVVDGRTLDLLVLILLLLFQ
tara:strand:- start:161 stop:325 length:165 start_codon:yes stop_codon:yes gene_type:complete